MKSKRHDLESGLQPIAALGPLDRRLGSSGFHSVFYSPGVEKTGLGRGARGNDHGRSAGERGISYAGHADLESVIAWFRLRPFAYRLDYCRVDFSLSYRGRDRSVPEIGRASCRERVYI